MPNCMIIMFQNEKIRNNYLHQLIKTSLINYLFIIDNDIHCRNTIYVMSR